MNHYDSSSRPLRRMPKKRRIYPWLLAFGVVVVLAVLTALLFHKPVTGSVPAAVSKPAAVKPPVAAKPAFNACDANTAGQEIIVSISKQHLWACNGTTETKETPVTTGISVVRNGVNDSTPTGTWAIQAKYRNVHLRGTDANGSWDDPVQYWMPFDRAAGIGFHDASWQTFPFGDSQYQTDGSHGCVHLPTDFIAWLYDWAPIGTQVIVQA